MENDKTGRSLLAEEHEARESGNSLKALSLAERAFFLFVEEDDVIGQAETLTAQAITLGHLAEEKQDDSYKVRAKHTAMSAHEIAQRFENASALALPFFGMGRVMSSFGEYEKAIPFYNDALAALPNSEHNRPGVEADMRVHLEVAQLAMGDKDALIRTLKAIDEIALSDENKYEKDVWVSGGYLKLAEVLFEEYPDEAKKYLKIAEEIILANPELVVRKRQLESLQKKVN